MTDPTELHLLRGIIAHPHDDTARLVYADWLDENPEPPRKCARCKGKRNWHDALTADGRCYDCRGTGTVSDGRAERAEFIRVQVALARGDYPAWLIGRETLLLTDDRRREWARVPWVAGDAFGREPFATDPPNGSFHRGQATPHYRRGFVSRVEVPGLEWVFQRVAVDCSACGATGSRYESSGRKIQCPECHGTRTDSTRTEWRVTPWALAVGRAHPVTEFVIGGLEPYLLHDLGDEQIWVWLSDDSERNRDHPTACIPKVVYDRLKEFDPTGYFGAYLSVPKALDALATAAADVVREAVLAAWAKELQT